MCLIEAKGRRRWILLAGRIHFMVASAPALLPHVRTGELRALCVNADHRLALLPDVPTAAEAGLPGYQTYNWHALFAPLDTPEPIIKRLNEALAKSPRHAPGAQAVRGDRHRARGLQSGRIGRGTQAGG
jgi:tripartite-type tricarboxylate transporter receptor subunit TctC